MCATVGKDRFFNGLANTASLYLLFVYGQLATAVYRGPESIDDPLRSSMATYRWKNVSDLAVHDYAALYHLKHWLATGIDTAINMWCVQAKQRENPGAEPEYTRCVLR